MIQAQITEQEWLKLPMPVRIELRTIFAIPRSRGTVVEDGVVKSDGYTNEDLKAITVEKMQTYLKSTEPDFYLLLNDIVKKVTDTLSKEEKEFTIKENYARVEKYIGMVKELRKQCYEFALGELFDTRIAEIFNIKPNEKRAEKKQDEGGHREGDGAQKGDGTAA